MEYGCAIEALFSKITQVLSEPEISRIARESGFVVRESKKITAAGFLKMLLYDQLKYENPSLQQHIIELEATEGIRVSEEGLNKRFSERAVVFTKKILEAYLCRHLVHDNISTHLKDKYTAIRILDSTEFKLPDALADAFPGYGSKSALSCAAIQFEYDILNKGIFSLDLGNARESDKTYADERMGNVREGELLLRDLGYYSIGSYTEIEARDAFYISRLKSQIKIYEKKDGRYVGLDLATLVKRIKKSKQAFLDQTVYIGAEEKKEVRLMAWLLSEDEQSRRLANKRARKGKSGSQAALWGMLNVFITNIPPEDLTVRQAYELYTIRWQVELMFKVWKSILKLNVVRKMKANRLKCYLYAKLLWILLCWDITATAEPGVWAKQGQLLSPYKCFSILKHRAAEIKGALFSAGDKLREWLAKMIDYFSVYGLKENKKGRKDIAEILGYTTIKQQTKR